MKTQLVKLSKIKPNPENPRIIKDTKYKKLVESIKEFPEMLNVRPIVVNEEFIVLGGNMRLRACKEAGLKEVPIVQTKFTARKQREFTIKDNSNFGEWDFDMLANEWDNKELEEWGIDVPSFDDVDLNEFFNEDQTPEQEQIESEKIILEYTIEESIFVREELLKHGHTLENGLWSLLKK